MQTLFEYSQLLMTSNFSYYLRVLKTKVRHLFLRVMMHRYEPIDTAYTLGCTFRMYENDLHRWHRSLLYFFTFNNTHCYFPSTDRRGYCCLIHIHSLSLSLPVNNAVRNDVLIVAYKHKDVYFEVHIVTGEQKGKESERRRKRKFQHRTVRNALHD